MTGGIQSEKSKGWFEEYRCGCVSEIVRRKKDLLGYCEHHGDKRRGVFRKFSESAAIQTERILYE